MTEEPKLSPGGEERRTRMLLELQGAMQRRAARRRTARRAGSAAAFFLAVGAVWTAVWMQRPPTRPAPGPIAAHDAMQGGGAPEQLGPRRSNVDLVPPPKRTAVALVRSTDPASVAKYVAPSTSRVNVEVVSDDGLMQALARTGDDYGLMRVGDAVRIKCNSCEGGEAPWERDLPDPTADPIDEP